MPKGEIECYKENCDDCRISRFSGYRLQGCPLHRVMHALEESVKLQSHYASLLNGYDAGKRIQFKNADEWIDRVLQRGIPTKSCNCPERLETCIGSFCDCPCHRTPLTSDEMLAANFTLTKINPKETTMLHRDDLSTPLVNALHTGSEPLLKETPDCGCEVSHRSYCEKYPYKYQENAREKIRAECAEGMHDFGDTESICLHCGHDGWAKKSSQETAHIECDGERKGNAEYKAGDARGQRIPQKTVPCPECGKVWPDIYQASECICDSRPIKTTEEVTPMGHCKWHNNRSGGCEECDEVIFSEHARYEMALKIISEMPNAPAVARNALHPIDPEELKKRLGPSVAEELAAIDQVPVKITALDKAEKAYASQRAMAEANQKLRERLCAAHADYPPSGLCTCEDVPKQILSVEMMVAIKAYVDKVLPKSALPKKRHDVDSDHIHDWVTCHGTTYCRDCPEKKPIRKLKSYD